MIYKLSVDQEVKIKLTPKGKAILQALLITVVSKPPQSQAIKLREDKEGYIDITLWQFAAFFGQLAGNLEDNSIFLEVK